MNQHQRFVSTKPVTNCGPYICTEAHQYASGKDFEYDTCDNEFSLYIVPDKSLIFLNPRPESQALGTIYPSEYIPFHFHELTGIVRRARSFLQRGKAQAILDLAGENGVVLDAGCGGGSLVRMLAELRGSTEGIYANDFADEIVAPLRKIGFKTIVGELNALETDIRFDVISLNQVIEHLPDPWEALRALAELLKPGGHLFIETPSIEAIDAHLFRGRYWGGYHIPRHFFLFTEKSLGEALENTGVSVVATRYLPNPIFWIQSLHHYFIDRGHPRVANFFRHTNWPLMGFFTCLDIIVLMFYRKTSNMRMIAQKP